MTPKPEKIEVRRGSGSSWGPAWDEKSTNSGLGRFWPILAGLGTPKMEPIWPKLAPSWTQDGAKMVPKPPKIYKKSIPKCMLFFKGFWMHFGRDLGAKIEEKSIQKRCQKRVGIDLEVKVAKTQKLTPLTAFLKVFQVKLGPKSIKNR